MNISVPNEFFWIAVVLGGSLFALMGHAIQEVIKEKRNSKKEQEGREKEKHKRR